MLLLYCTLECSPFPLLLVATEVNHVTFFAIVDTMLEILVIVCVSDVKCIYTDCFSLTTEVSETMVIV